MIVFSHAMSTQRQKGVALAMSLVILAAISVLAVTSLSGTTLSAKQAANTQQRAIAFEAAESALEQVWDAELMRATAISGASVINSTPEAVVVDPAITGFANSFDTPTEMGSVDIDGEVTMQYCGEVPVVSGSMNADESVPKMVGMLVDSVSEAQIDSTRTRVVNVQRGVVTSVATGRSGGVQSIDS